MEDFNVSCENCKNGIYRKYSVTLKETDTHDVIHFFIQIKPYTETIIKGELLHRKGVKWFVCLQLQYRKRDNEGTLIFVAPYFQSFAQTVLHGDDISDQVDLAFGKILTSTHDFHLDL